MRMVWMAYNPNEPRYKLVKWRRPSLRGHGLDRPGPKLAWDREVRRKYPGETGKWPRGIKAKRKSNG